MALRGIFGYRHLDSSVDYNARSSRIIDRTILDGGTLTYNGTLNVTIAPFIAHSYDGLVIISDTSVTVTVIDGQSNIIICQAQYQASSAPVIQMSVITELEWLTSINKNNFIVFAKFDLTAGGFSSVSNTEADYSISDFSDKLGKNNWRPVSATQATLPTSQNRDGDTRIALDTRISYTWNNSTKTWVPTKTKSNQVDSIPYLVLSATNVQDALEQLVNLYNSSFSASSITNTPAGNISATNVQAAINELDTEKIGVSGSNTFTADQTINATGFNSSKLTIINGSVAGSSHWAQTTDLSNDFNHLRINLAGSGSTDPKQFQLTINANYNSGTSQYSADAPGAAVGNEAGMVRYDTNNHKITFGYLANTSSAWLDSLWNKTDLLFPKTGNLSITFQSNGTLATSNTVTLSDRIVYTSMALTSKIYVSFTRKFLVPPAGVSISIVGGSETNVSTATVSDITVNGFVITVTPSVATTPATPAIFTLDRTWSTL